MGDFPQLNARAPTVRSPGSGRGFFYLEKYKDRFPASLPAQKPEPPKTGWKPLLLSPEFTVQFGVAGKDQRGASVRTGIGHFGFSEVVDQPFNRFGG